MSVPVALPAETVAFVDAMAAPSHRREPYDTSRYEKNGSRLLDVYDAGDLALLKDADGEFLAEFVSQGLDINWAMESMYDAFYKYHEDDYDYLCLMMVKDLGMFFAFYQPMANDVKGIGYDTIVPNEVFDQTSDTKIQGLIFMNSYQLWIDDPVAARYVFGQEFMHRWGAFVNVDHAEIGSEELLGRDVAHWSYWLDTTNSPMEGNDWTDNGDGTWTVDPSSGSTYSDLDLYLMGLVGPEAVPPQTLLRVAEDEQSRVGREPASTPEYLADDQGDSTEPITVAATAIGFTLDDIVAAEGERVPAADEAPRSFRMAFLVLLLADDEPDDATLADVDDLRRQFEADWEADVRGLADLDTTLGASTAPTWGDDGTDTGTDTGSDTSSGDSAVDSDPADTDGAANDDGDDTSGGCACSAGPTAPSRWRLGALAAVLAMVGFRRRR